MSAATDGLRDRIAALAVQTMGGDWDASAKPALLSVMGTDALKARDVPVAMEMASLLYMHIEHADMHERAIGPFHEDVALSPGLVWDSRGKLVLMLEVPEDSLSAVAGWLADGLQSARVCSLPGVLALPFTVERPAGDDGEEVLFPDWFAVFYPHGRQEHAFPILALRSVLSNEAFGGDWVDAAVGRMGFYGLPRKLAEHFVARGVEPL